MDITKIKSVAVHDGTFHADEVFAVATLSYINPDFKVIRTRDLKMLADSDLRIDVGGEYNPKTGDFDHHQIGGAGKRNNGIPYSSFGLIWLNYGKEVCEEILKQKLKQDKTKLSIVVNSVDETLVQRIDASDTGYSLMEITNASPYLLTRFFSCMNPNPQEDISFDNAFSESVDIAKTILKREILRAYSSSLSYQLVISEIKKQKDKEYLILSENCSWEKPVVENSNKKYVILPDKNGKQWRIYTVPEKLGTFEYRKLLPESWAGLMNEELQKVTGVSDATFCHTKRFTAGAKSLDGAIRLAELALES